MPDSTYFCWNKENASDWSNSANIIDSEYRRLLFDHPESYIQTWLAILRKFDLNFLHIYRYICRTKPIETLELARPRNDTQFAIEDQHNQILHLDRLQDTPRWSILDLWKSVLLKRGHLDRRRHRHHTTLNQIINNAVFILLNRSFDKVFINPRRFNDSVNLIQSSWEPFSNQISQETLPTEKRTGLGKNLTMSTGSHRNQKN